jgi:uncharacterized membrane-anchored protein
MASHVRVGLVVAAQLGILVAVPARQLAARYAGTPVTLRTAPVDPYDVLAGHYVTLSYEVERKAAGAAEPGLEPGDDVWLTVKSGDPAWTLEKVTRARPPAGAPGVVSIRATWRGGRGGEGWVELDGARRLYLPQGRAQEIDAARRGSDRALVDLRVGRDGTPAIVGLRLGRIEVRDE